MDTWLHSHISSSELGFYNYVDVYRCDRSTLTSKFKRGGGVLIAIRKDLKSHKIITPNTPNEHVFVCFYIQNARYIISSVYIPSSSPYSIYESHVEINP